MKNSLRCQHLIADRDLLWGQEAGVTHVDGARFQPLHPVFHAHSRLPGNRILTSLDSLHVHGDLTPQSEAEIAGAARDVRGIRARHEGFRRDAAGVDAGPAEVFALDDGDFHPGFDQAGGERGSRLPGSDDDSVEFLHFQTSEPA